MSPEDMKGWRKSRGLGQDDAGAELGITARAVRNYETGARPIPADIAHRIMGEPLPAECKPAPVMTVAKAAVEGALKRIGPFDGDPWKSPRLSKFEKDQIRFALAPGAPGWRYLPGSTLPKGQWIETLDAPWVQPSGSLIRAVRWCSNGVGVPSMVLMGEVVERPGATYWSDALPKGVYQPATPNQGDPSANPPPSNDGGRKARKAA